MTTTVIKRKTTNSSGNGANFRSTSFHSSARSPKQSFLITPALVVGALCVAAYMFSETALFPSSQPKQYKVPEGNRYPIENNVVLLLDLDEGSETLGPHRAKLLAGKNDCPNLGFWLRLEGDALETVLLEESGDSWEGTFSFPIAGKYEIAAYWKGCDHPSSDVKRIPILNINVTGRAATSERSAATTNDFATLFPKAAWISSKKFHDVPKVTPYVWHDPSIAATDAALITTSNSTVSKQGATFPDNGFFLFRKLSNYELVCWVGSQSAADSRNVFLEERRSIAAGQRPFKFHIYSSNNFLHPAEDWPENEQSRFRKCKHILVSIDQIKTPLTQQEYATQVTRFINHLLKAFPDDTFPIWMFTVNESPMNPTNCFPPYIARRTSDHPCNDVLKELFLGEKKIFPERVHFLDNTALSLPQLGENQEDVTAAIAMRIFVFVGKRVQEWRESGQEGKIDGLHRGGVVEPNFDLVPYMDWQ
ncbi:hypothetical protein IV203_029053 [Nitzschia inconspicua]|uniref:Uncharacterized protein n=1 Tax=Nitzschia inconspicua TaxID=303405 RepID=A0A9K3LPZ7_9STRA|nr:hypothetical protein IV203_029053 [Nitzschia inconspicua]